MPAKAPNAARSKTSVASGALLADVASAKPLRLPVAGDVVGEAGSKAALAELAKSIALMKAAAVAPLLDKAVQALRREDAVEAGKLATEALNHDELNGFAWYLLAIARERLGDFKSSIQCYDSALKLLPDHDNMALVAGTN